MDIYLTEKEVLCLIQVSSEWCQMLENCDEDFVTPMLNDGLGSALYKLYKGRNGQTVYKEYAKRGNRK